MMKANRLNHLKSFFPGSLLLGFLLMQGWIPSMHAQFVFPQIQQFNPQAGEPGTVVVIQGTNFGNVQSVLFGIGSAAFESVSATQIRAVVPDAATTGPITVTTDRGIGISASFFQVAPRIESFEPVFGKPGDVIILRGANFTGLSEVWIGEKQAAFQTVGDTQLSFLVPAESTTGPLRLVSPAGEAVSETDFQVIGPEPFILEFDPPMAAPGDLIVLRGVQFSQASEVLFFDDQAGSFSVVADTQIIVRVPTDAESGPVSIETPAGTGVSTADFLVIGTGPFISALDPTEGQAGDTITASGINLTGVSKLLVNGEEASFEVVADTQLHFVIPADATTGPIEVESPDGTDVFEEGLVVIGPGPVIDSFSPASGLPGALIQVQGSHFTQVEHVWVGELETEFEVAAETQLTLVVPVDAETGTIRIETAFGETESQTAFIVKEPSPELTSFEPTFGPVGTAVTLHGLHLNGVTEIKIGGEETAFEIVADTQILTTVPADAVTGAVELISGEVSFVSDSLFYLPVQILETTPDKAVPGTDIEITGKNMTGTSRVRMGGKEAEILVVEAESVTVRVPDDALIGPISVTTPAGTLATMDDYGILPQVDAISPVAGPVGATLQVIGKGLTEVQTVLMAGVVSVPFQVVSSELIELTIPSNAASGSLTVQNPAGESTSSQTFELRDSADLSLEVIMEGQGSTWQIPDTFTIRVKNDGPSPARNFLVRHLMPEGLQLIDATNPGGSTDVSGSSVIASVVNLEAGASLEMTQRISTPHFGAEEHTFVIDAEIFDPTMEDQQVILRRTITGLPIQLEILHLEPQGVRVRWHAAMRGFRLQHRGTLDGDAVWANLDEDPSFDGAWQYVDLETSDTVRFLRLIEN